MPVAGGFSDAVSHIEGVPQPTRGGDVDDEAALALCHHPRCKDSAEIVASEPDSIKLGHNSKHLKT